jgi:phosphoglycolate phosphatase-like HAD superfamily hydrolase
MKRISFSEWLERQPIVLEQLLSDLGVNKDRHWVDSEFERIFHEILEDEPALRPRLFGDVVKTLTILNRPDVDLIIVSAHATSVLERELVRLGIRDFFTGISGGTSQDKESALRTVCRQYRINVNRAVFFGDTIHDIISGRKAAIKTIGICTGYNNRDYLVREHPDILASSLTDAIDQLCISD